MLVLFAFYGISENVNAQPSIPKTPLSRTLPPAKLLEEDIKSYVDLLNNGTAFMGGQLRIVGARAGFLGANEWQRWWEVRPGKDALKVENVIVNKIEGTQAEINIKYRTGDFPDAQPKVEGPFTVKFAISPLDYSLRGAKPVWQFVPQSPAETETIGAFPLRWSIWMLAQTPESLEQFRAAVYPLNLKQLSLAARQFFNDFEEKFAFLPEFQEEALLPYLRNPTLWIIPGTKEKFLFNARLSGKMTQEIAEPARTILFYDGADGQPIFRYTGKTAICFVDGHVELATPEQFKAFRWE